MGGWIHRIEAIPALVVQPLAWSRPRATIDALALMHGWRHNTTPREIDALALILGVSAMSLAWLGAAFAPEHSAWAFGMRDARGDLTGIRLRSETRKWSVTGSRHGLFFPVDALNILPTDRVFICEGPTDTAAALSINIFALGRPSCQGCEEMVSDALTQIGAKECVVVSDNDGPGLKGSSKLMESLRLPTVEFIPPAKDFRSFVRFGGTSELVSTLISGSKWMRPKSGKAFLA